MNMYTKIKVYSKKKYLVLYFKKNGGVVRYNTNIRIKNKRNELRSDGFFLSDVPDAETHNENLKELKNLVDLAIGNLLSQNPSIILNNEKIKAEIERINYIRQTKDVIGYYDDFLKSKIKKVTLKPQSRKDYYSLQNALKDYELMFNKKIQIEQLDHEFIDEFIRFLELPHVSSKEKEYITKGDLSKNTIIKRIDNLKEFLRYLDKHRIRDYDEEINESKLSGYDTDFVTLDLDEIEFLDNYRIENEEKYTKKQIEIFDAFLFNLEVGLRFSDLSTIDKSNFNEVDIDGEKRLKLTKIMNKNSVKHRSTAIVPLTRRADNIIRKYNFHFNLTSNQVFNTAIKKILKDSEHFETEIKINSMNTLESKEAIYKKRQLIGCHTCRRTFITLQFKKGTPIPDVMRMSGHKKISTLQKYIDKHSPNEFQYVD